MYRYQSGISEAMAQRDVTTRLVGETIDGFSPLLAKGDWIYRKSLNDITFK